MRTLSRPLLCAWMFFATANGAVADSAGQPTPDVRAKALMAEVLAIDRGPGLQAAVVRNGATIFEHAAGKAHLELDVDLTPTHRQRIGSVSKPVTAALLMRLVDEGVLSIDDGVRELVPSLPDHYGQITLRQLASHTAGVRHFDFANFTEANNMLYRPRLIESIGAWIDDDLLAPPGSEFHYSSHGYNLIGVAIENATQMSFGNALQRYLTGPLSLADILVDHPLDVTARRAAHYTVTYANPVFPWMVDGATINTIFRDSSDYYPSGGLLANARALAQFVDAVMAGAALDDEQRVALRTPALLNTGGEIAFAQAGPMASYGLGWTIMRDSDGAVIWTGHDGETNGAYALVRYFPATQISVAAIANYNVVAREPMFFDAMGTRLPALFGN